MSPEKQQIAIAEACGIPLYQDRWLYSYNEGQTTSRGHISREAAITDAKSHNVFREPTGYRKRTTLPDYLSDLNAMNEAEKVLTVEQHSEYQWRLRCIIAGKEIRGITDFELLHATAAQRAEAFLRTIGKWEEE